MTDFRNAGDSRRKSSSKKIALTEEISAAPIGEHFAALRRGGCLDGGLPKMIKTNKIIKTSAPKGQRDRDRAQINK